MLRSPSTSHTFEVVLSPSVSSDDTFTAIWTAYFKDRLSKMAAHPVSNFVFSKAVQRLDADKLEETLKVFKAEKIGKALLGAFSTVRVWDSPHSCYRDCSNWSTPSTDRPLCRFRSR
jgi:hypothetical protein